MHRLLSILFLPFLTSINSYKNKTKAKAPVRLPILEFTAAQNLLPGKSYNLYPIRMSANHQLRSTLTKQN
jgi:hypothetical protein